MKYKEMNKLKCSATKYHFVDGQAYTEDEILIYNIFTYNIPIKACLREVTKYFQQFGNVLKIVLESKSSKICFVDFANPEAAAKALQHPRHLFMNCILRLQSCPSYFQPYGQKVIKQLSHYNINDSNGIACCCSSLKLSQKSSILTLNNDCLLYICKYLKPEDQINFALTSQCLYDIFRMFSYTQYANFTTKMLKSFTDWQTTIFLHIVGPQIKTLTIEIGVTDIIDYCKQATCVVLLGLFCTNVENLKVISSCIESKFLIKLINNMPKIKHLYLNNVNNNFVSCLKILEHITTLTIRDSDITGRHIHLLLGLEILTLNGCYKISNYWYKQIFKNLKKLQYLDLKCCTPLEMNDLKVMGENLLELETLKLSLIDKNIDFFQQLHKLKHLEIHNDSFYNNSTTTITEEFIKNLTNQYADQLEDFKLINLKICNFDLASYLVKLEKLKVLYCDNGLLNDIDLQKISQLRNLEELHLNNSNNISDKGVLHVLQDCLTLKVLNLSNCYTITHKLVDNAIELLIKQRAHSLKRNRVNLLLPNDHAIALKLDLIDLKNYSDVLVVTLIETSNTRILLDRWDQYNHAEDDDDDDDYYYGYFNDDDIPDLPDHPCF